MPFNICFLGLILGSYGRYKLDFSGEQGFEYKEGKWSSSNVESNRSHALLIQLLKQGFLIVQGIVIRAACELWLYRNNRNVHVLNAELVRNL